MNFFQIPTHCKLGVKNLDDQHHELVKIVASLNDHLGPDSLPQVLEIFARFREFMVDHLAEEEALMEETGFPDVAAHSLHHQQLLQETDSIIAIVRDRNRLIKHDINECLDKVVRHMLAADAPFNTHLHQIQYSNVHQQNHATN